MLYCGLLDIDVQVHLLGGGGRGDRKERQRDRKMSYEDRFSLMLEGIFSDFSLIRGTIDQTITCLMTCLK